MREKLTIKVFVLIILSFFIVQCDEVDDALYGDESGGSNPVSGSDQPFEPEDIIGMTLWLDSSDTTTLFTDTGCTTAATVNGDAIACWQDKSGNNLNATQATLSRRPLLAVGAQNSLNAVEFIDDNQHNLDVPSTSWGDGTHDFTVFVVYNQALTDTLGVMFSTYPNAANDLMLTTTTYTSNKYRYYDLNNWRTGSAFSAGAWNVDSYHRTSNSMSLYMNGSLDATMAALNGVSPGVARIGSYTNSFSNLYEGHIAEIVWFSHSLTVEERQKMEGYLAHKWNRTIALDPSHPYKTDPPTTFVPDP